MRAIAGGTSTLVRVNHSGQTHLTLTPVEGLQPYSQLLLSIIFGLSFVKKSIKILMWGDETRHSGCLTTIGY